MSALKRGTLVAALAVLVPVGVVVANKTTSSTPVTPGRVLSDPRRLRNHRTRHR